MRKVLALVLAMVLLASAVPLMVTPAAALYEKKLPCDVDENNELTKVELVNVILPYMLDEGDFTLDDVEDASWVYAYWDGKTKTIVDQVDRTVTFYRPVERVITIMPPITRVVIGLGAVDKIVGMGTWSHSYTVGGPSRGCGPKWDEACGKLREVPDVGTAYDPNKELIISLNPDVIIPYVSSPYLADALQGGTGIPVLVAYPLGSGAEINSIFEQIKVIAEALVMEEEAEELISYFKKELDKVTEVTSQIPDSEKPRVYHIWGSIITKASLRYEPVELAGGILVSKDCAPPTFGGSVTDVSKEQIIDWNPGIILLMKSSTNPELTVGDVLNDPDFQTINAVKNQSVYHTPGAFYLVGADHPRVIWETLYMAKLFHPDKFKDLDLEEEGNELFERFYGVDGLWTEIGGNLGFV